MIHSDLQADGDKCGHCERPLHRNYGGHELYETLRMYDGEIVNALVVDVICESCGCANEIFLQAWLPSTPNMARLMAEYKGRKRRFACAPTV